VLVAAEIEFCLLGPLSVRRRAVAVTVPRGKQRVILAMLLLNAGRVVSVDELAETLWLPGPPPSGPVAVQNHVMRLRNTLGDAGRARIITQPPGYLIRVETGELDLSCFEALLGAARAAAQDGSWDQAATHAREALELWRGEPLTGVESEALAALEAPRLAELRLQALELRIDADLHLGRHTQVITELQQLAGAHPLRERLHGQLMLALYRGDRQAEALAAYQHARDVLVAEVGVEPGPGLRDLHQRILSADPALTGTEPAPPAQAEPEQITQRRIASPAPRELPPSVSGFTGRSAELQALTRLLDRPGQQVPRAVVISAIGGTAGVGKTALAVHWAHQAAGRFPDGQLYVNLRGYDPDQPMTAAEALAGFLGALGVPGQDIPLEAAERAARYRSVLAGKRVLVVLDNAGSAEQVRPLLPGTPGCVVVVTSRDSLAGLVARDGARRLDLDLLPLPDAVGLLHALIGGRVDADPGAAATLAELCARLPLALRVAAELAAARPAAPLAELDSELADQQRRLDLLDAGGDPRTAVRAVFSWSYRHLGTDARCAFRLLGLHPGPDVDPYAAAALTASTIQHSRQVLGVLARAHLIQPASAGRYNMHDLLRAYATHLARSEDSEQDRRAALTRLFDYYLAAAAAAMDALVPAELHRRPRIPPPATPVPDMTTPDAAQTWLDAERATLATAAAHTAAYGWAGHTTRLATTLYRYLDTGGHLPDALVIHTHALHAARHIGDPAAHALALMHLGVAYIRQGRYQQAADHLQQALALCRETGDRLGEARALSNLGLAHNWQGNYAQASGNARQALALCRETGDRLGEAYALTAIAIGYMYQGRPEAIAQFQLARALYRELGESAGEATALGNLGEACWRQGHLDQAATHLREALIVARATGSRGSQAYALTHLGLTYQRQGRHEEAIRYLQQGLDLCREIGFRNGETEALNGTGETLLATGQPGQARACHAAALTLARQWGDRYGLAWAHSGLARAWHASGDLTQARHHWQQALTLYTDLRVPEADEVQDQLAAVGSRDDPPPR
jgi:DNA-binding SARP family transcriptional activator/Tfp pilus assembly protein PilF